jgi:hypothetical protein
MCDATAALFHAARLRQSRPDVSVRVIIDSSVFVDFDGIYQAEAAVDASSIEPPPPARFLLAG